MEGGEVANGVLGEMRVQFHLVDGREQATTVDQFLEVVRFEIAHPHRLGPPGFGDLLHRVPCAQTSVLVLQRPVHQVEVDVVEPEARQARVERGQRGFVALVGVPQLGGDEDLVAGTADFAMPRPTPSSLPYAAAVSMCR